MPINHNPLVSQLNQAILAKNIDAIKVLLEQFDEKNINDYDVNDVLNMKRPIDCAIESGAAEIVQLICNKKPRLDEPCKSNGYYPVHLAMFSDLEHNNGDEFKKIFEILYLSGANFNVKEKINGFSLVHLALKEHKSAYITPLVELLNCDINAVDKENRTPLKYAINTLQPDNVIETIRMLGGKEFSNATVELHEGFNKSQELYSKYVKRYPIRWNRFKDNISSIPEEEDLILSERMDSASLTSTPHGLFFKVQSDENQRVSDKIIQAHVKAILGNTSEKMYNVFLHQLENNPNKETLIKAIVLQCEEQAEKAKNAENFTQRIAFLNHLKAPSKEASQPQEKDLKIQNLKI